MHARYYFPRIKNHLKTGLLVYHFLDGLVIKKNHVKKKKTLLVIRLDSIGDYLLFRNFLKPLCESNAYEDHHITLCGNKDWKEIAETFDAKYVTDFIWIDINRFYKNPFYRLKTLGIINRRAFESAIQPTYSREYFLEGVIRATQAVHRIGNQGDLTQMNTLQKAMADRYYTQLLPAKKEVLFEFHRNKEFFESLMGMKLDIRKPHLEIVDIPMDFSLPDSYAVFFPGARMKFKKWDAGNYAEMADFLWEKYKLSVVVLGSKSESLSAKKISEKSGSKNIIDWTGKTRLTQVAKIISDAKILISNDSCAIHFAASVNTKTIAVLSGNFFGRFSPYPKEIFDGIYSVYPKLIMNQYTENDYIKEKYRYSTDLHVNDIGTAEVKSMIERVL